ncbi:hypothetical protein LCGC14_0365710 [marine sediment metagenome]|uniref:CpXC domain-containing protein n=1 Tax=marine sediment metagenome TaxID=412755 RepID=A0A0F9TCM8_9ZZZZ
MKVLCKTCGVISEGVEPIEAVEQNEVLKEAYTGLLFQCPICQCEWFVSIRVVYDREAFSKEYTLTSLTCRDGRSRWGYERKSMLERIQNKEGE